MVTVFRPTVCRAVREAQQTGTTIVPAWGQFPRCSAAAPDLTAAVLDYNLGANNSVLVGWRLHSCGVPFLFYTGRFDLRTLPWPTVPVIHKPSPMIRIVSALSSLITCGT